MGDIKTIDVKEFVEMGFLQEANRQFFHPLGLALSVNVEWPENCSEEEKEKYNNNELMHPDSVWSLGSVWDYRKDDEGMLFGEGMIDKNKFLRVNTLRESKVVYRSRLPECDEEGIQRVEK